MTVPVLSAKASGMGDTIDDMSQCQKKRAVGDEVGRRGT
jgi:hypothetical protein